MTATYENIATTTLGSDTQAEFTNISQNYTDLLLVIHYGVATNNDPLVLRVGNGTIDTGNNYSSTILYGTGTTAGSYRESNTSIGAAGTFFLGSSTAIEQTSLVFLMNYSNTTTNKTIIERSGGAGRGAETAVSLWRSTLAINRILIGAAGGMARNMKSGSVLTLYGIKAE